MAKVFIFLVLLIGLVNWGVAQDVKQQSRDYVTTAELMIEETKALDDARQLMVVAADLDTTNFLANYKAAMLHLTTINKNEAVKYLMRIYRQNPAFRFDLEFQIARSYQFGLHFDRAIDFYERYKKKYAKRPNYQKEDKVELDVVERHIFECFNGKDYLSQPRNFSIVNLGKEINSEYDDYGPVLNEREDEIIFTTRRKEGNLSEDVDNDNKPFEDIFYSRKVNGVWERARNIAMPVGTTSHESTLALSADGNTLFIYSVEGGGDIYFSDRQANGQWSAPVALPGIINSPYSEKSITISRDEKTLFFSSNRPGGLGGYDIYKAVRDSKGNWSNVQNLGDVINTEFDEEGPFMDLDDVNFYFSSNGHGGMGGFDIYKSVIIPSSGELSQPLNLGYPVNTPDDDVFFVVSKDGKRAYYSSVKTEGFGYVDIYRIDLPDGL